MSSRTKLIACIHVGKKNLGLSDPNYRALLEAVTRKDSLRAMSDKELSAVIERMKSLGFKKKSKPKRAGTRKMATGDQARLIRALWLSLYHLGEVRDPSEEAMSAYVKRMTKIEDVKWLDIQKSNIVVSGLRDWMKRVGYVRPTDRNHNEFGYINSNNYENLNNAATNINAAHVLMAQANIAFNRIKDYHHWLAENNVTHADHPYAMSVEEIYSLTEKLGTRIRKKKGSHA